METSVSGSGSGLSFNSAGPLPPTDFGIPNALDPRKTSVITSVCRGDPIESGLWKVMQGDDRGGDWNLSVFLNDIGVNRDDDLYVSDSGLGAIYRVKAGETTLWVKNAVVAGVNGLVVQGDRLFATTMGSQSLVAIRLETGEVESIVDLRPFGGDGIVPDGDGAFLVSDFNGLLLRVTTTGEREVLIDTRDAGISLTDFGYSHDHKLVVIPTLRGNSLLAFKLN